MQYIQGIDRFQRTFTSLKDGIMADNEERFVEVFVEKIDFEKLGFFIKTIKIEGRPPYESKIFYRKRQEINEHIFGTIKRK